MYVAFRFRAKLDILRATTSAARVKNYIKVSCVQTTTKFSEINLKGFVFCLITLFCHTPGTA